MYFSMTTARLLIDYILMRNSYQLNRRANSVVSLCVGIVSGEVSWNLCEACCRITHYYKLHLKYERLLTGTIEGISDALGEICVS